MTSQVQEIVYELFIFKLGLSRRHFGLRDMIYNSSDERNIQIVRPDNEPMTTSCVCGPLGAHSVIVACRYEAFCSTRFSKG